MTTTLLSNKEKMQGVFKKPKETRPEYLEVTGIKKYYFKSLPRDIQKEIDSIIVNKTTTIWTKRP